MVSISSSIVNILPVPKDLCWISVPTFKGILFKTVVFLTKLLDKMLNDLPLLIIL